MAKAPCCRTIGFERAGDFATAFRLRFGMTPLEHLMRRR
jgi:AraC-like DNA-binding protein